MKVLCSLLATAALVSSQSLPSAPTAADRARAEAELKLLRLDLEQQAAAQEVEANTQRAAMEADMKAIENSGEMQDLRARLQLRTAELKAEMKAGTVKIGPYGPISGERVTYEQLPGQFVERVVEVAPVQTRYRPAPSQYVVQRPAPSRVMQRPAPSRVVQRPEPVRVVQQPAPSRVVQRPEPVRVVQRPEPVHVVQQPTVVVVEEPGTSGYVNFADVLQYDLDNRLEDDIVEEWGYTAYEYMDGGSLHGAGMDIYLISILTDNDESEMQKFNDALDYGYASNGFGQGIRFDKNTVNSQELLIETLDSNMQDYLFDKILDDEPTDDIWADVEEDFQEDLIWSGFQGHDFMKWLLIQKYYDSGESKVTNDFLEIALLGGMGEVNPLMLKYLLDDDDDSGSVDDNDSFLEMMMFAGGNMGSTMGSNAGLMLLLLDDDDDGSADSADDDDSLMKMLAFGGLGGGENAVNPLLLALIMDDEDKDSGDDDDSMLQYLMLSSGTGI